MLSKREVYYSANLLLLFGNFIGRYLGGILTYVVEIVCKYKELKITLLLYQLFIACCDLFSVSLVVLAAFAVCVSLCVIATKYLNENSRTKD